VSHVHPWQVWLVDFGQPAGHEQGGIRPAVVVASDLHCRFPIDMTLVLPLTAADRGLPHHVSVSSGGAGLDRQSWVRTEDVTAISTTRLMSPHPLGRLSAPEVEAVQSWLRRMLAL